jgi:tetratricopeptide (TPR) repeat protein
MITSDSPELQNLQEDGIAAVKRRNLAGGRALLMQVVEQDEQQELAWLWLSVAVESSADKEIALENVLAINPDNATARKRLNRLKREEAVAAEAQTVVADDHFLAGAPQDVDDGLDDPYQCAYCGQVTSADDKTCPHCRKSLYLVVPKEAMSEFLKTALLLTGATAILGILQTATPFLALTAAQTADQSFFKVLLSVPGAPLILGNFLRPAYTASLAQKLIFVWAGRSGLLLVLLLGLRLRWTPAYFAAFGLFVADLLGNAGLLVTGYLGAVACILNVVLDIIILFLLAGSDREFAVIRERLWTQPDKRAHSARDFYWHGVVHSRQGRWALAVAQWRKAVGLAPTERRYAKDLGIGYAQIGRFDRSVRVLEEAQRQAPDDAQVAKILALVREQMARLGKRA